MNGGEGDEDSADDDLPPELPRNKPSADMGGHQKRSADPKNPDPQSAENRRKHWTEQQKKQAEERARLRKEGRERRQKEEQARKRAERERRREEKKKNGSGAGSGSGGVGSGGEPGTTLPN